MNKPLKVGFIGLKGIPAGWGGIETFVQEIAIRLAKRGHDINVYSKKEKYNQYQNFKELNIINSPTINIIPIESLVHAFTSSFHAISKNYDLIHLHGYMSYFTIPILKLNKKKIIITLHGAAWVNPSYNKLGKTIIKLASIIGIKLSDAVTAVSLPLKEEIEKHYRVKVTLTPIGSHYTIPVLPHEIIEKYNLEPNRFILFLGRLEKVKRVDWIIKAFNHINSSLNLIIAGDSQNQNYKNYLYNLSNNNKRIIFTGFVESKLKDELMSNCLFFVLPSFVEGMPASLLEAMSYGKASLVSDISAHKWLIKDSQNGFLFSHTDYNNFVEKIGNIVTMPVGTLSKIGIQAREFVRNKFNWDATANLLENLYFRILEKNN